MKTHNNNPFGQINVIGVDPNWYVDSRAKNHVTPEFNNLINPIEYGGKELVMVRNGNHIYLQLVKLFLMVKMSN